LVIPINDLRKQILESGFLFWSRNTHYRDRRRQSRTSVASWPQLRGASVRFHVSGAQVRRYLVVRRPVAAVIGACLTVGECRRSVL
jgi:hypothetical protein